MAARWQVIFRQFSNGRYTLVVTGVIPPVVQVKIEVKPGNPVDVPVNPGQGRDSGGDPVRRGYRLIAEVRCAHGQAVLADVRQDRRGESYIGCHKHGIDVNADGLLDLVCTFDNQAANWDVDDVRGVMKG